MLNKGKLRVLVLGSDGMLGYDVMKAISESSAFEKPVGIDVEDGMDFTDESTLIDYFEHNGHFDYVINCIAYTDTKSAETTNEGMENSYELNAIIPKNIAYACNMFETKMIHVSTDWVFSEKNGKIMFSSFDTPYPVNRYGKDKLIGEQLIESEFGNRKSLFAILRVSWLYGMHKEKSFIHKFLRNIAVNIKNGNTSIDMVTDEFSIPTSTSFVIDCMKDVITHGLYGIHHAVPTLKSDNIFVSRFDYARKILSYMKKFDNAFESVTLNPVILSENAYNPHHSTMISDFRDMTWEEDIDRFFKNNMEELIGFFRKN